MKKLIILLMTLACLSLGLVGCDSQSSQGPNSQADTGNLKISLTDAPADFDAVNITFSEVSAHIDSNWIVLSDEQQTVNLLEFSNGKTTEIGSGDVPVGQYTQIRLKIADAEVVVDGQSYPVTVPSGAQSGLKLITQFSIVQGSSIELVADFDAHRSIITTGPPSAPKSYKLKPTIRVISDAVTGSLSGIVTNWQNLPVAYAITGTDTITSTQVEQSTGTCMLAFLPEAVYTVSISDTLAQSFEKSDAGVVAGRDNDLGALTLQ